MSISKKYLNAWNYDPEDLSSHETRAGLALLPTGVQWRTTEALAKLTENSQPKTVQQILAASNDSVAQAAAATHGPMPLDNSQPDLCETWTEPCAMDQSSEPVPQGTAVVNRDGKVLLMAQNTFAETDRADGNSPGLSNTGQLQGLQASRQRTTNLWRKINPGSMPEYTDLPLSTTHDLMVVDYAHIPPVDKLHFRQKNDFTEYTEQGASTMKALISDKK